MKDYVWLVTVTDEVLLFDKVDKPSDWEEKAIKQPYGELNGTYLGMKQFEADYWYLRRDKKMPENSGMSWFQWRHSQQSGSMEGYNPHSKYPYSYGYAWEPNFFYKYEGKLYTTGANFH